MTKAARFFWYICFSRDAVSVIVVAFFCGVLGSMTPAVVDMEDRDRLIRSRRWGCRGCSRVFTMCLYFGCQEFWFAICVSQQRIKNI